MNNPLNISSAQFWLRYQRYPMLLARLVFFALVLGATWWVLRSLSGVLVPVTLSMLLAYLLDPTIDWFEARGFNRTVGIVLFTGLAGLLFAVMGLFLYPTVLRIGEGIYRDVPMLFTTAESELVPWIEGQLAAQGLEMETGVSDILGDLSNRASENIPSILGDASSYVAGLFTQTGAAAAWLFNLVLIPILTFYFLRDFDINKMIVADYLPVKYKPLIIDRLTEMDRVVGAWLRGQIEVSIILGVLYAIGLAISFGLYTGDSTEGIVSGLAIGMVGGLLIIVPYLGFAIAFVMAGLVSLLAWAEGAGWSAFIGVLLTFSIAQTLEGYVVTPLVVGKKVGLSTVVVIIALLLGVEVLGLLGALLAIPVVGSLKVLLPDLIDMYKRSDLFLGDLVWSAKDLEKKAHAHDDAPSPPGPGPDAGPEDGGAPPAPPTGAPA